MKKFGNLRIGDNVFQYACEILHDKIPNLSDDIFWKYDIITKLIGGPKSEEIARKWKVSRTRLLNKLHDVPEILILQLLICVDSQIERTAEDYHKSDSKDALLKFQELILESQDHIIILSQ